MSNECPKKNYLRSSAWSAIDEDYFKKKKMAPCKKNTEEKLLFQHILESVLTFPAMINHHLTACVMLKWFYMI